MIEPSVTVCDHFGFSRRKGRKLFLCSDVFEPFAATTVWLKSVVRREEEDDFWVASEPLSQAS